MHRAKFRIAYRDREKVHSYELAERIKDTSTHYVLSDEQEVRNCRDAGVDRETEGPRDRWARDLAEGETKGRLVCDEGMERRTLAARRRAFLSSWLLALLT